MKQKNYSVYVLYIITSSKVTANIMNKIFVQNEGNRTTTN